MFKVQMLAAAALLLVGTSVSAKESPAHKSGASPPSSLVGHWESKKPYCMVDIQQRGNKLVGSYSASTLGESGRRVQEGDLGGTIKTPEHVRLVFSSPFAKDDDPHGIVDLDVTAGGLKWTLVKPAADEDYTPKTALMHKGKASR